MVGVHGTTCQIHLGKIILTGLEVKAKHKVDSQDLKQITMET